MNVTPVPPAPSLPHRMRPLDAGFLYAERPTAPLHIGCCLVYRGRLSREDLLASIGRRLHLLPRFRQRPIFPPFAVTHPSWEDDPAFDLHRHIAEASVSTPDDDQTLGALAGALFATPLNRSRPLWQLTLLPGRPDGRTAVVWKVHHALADGMSAMELLQRLHDLAPAPPAPPPAPPWQPRPLPDPLTLFQEGARDQWAAALQPPPLVGGALPRLLPPVPPTPFNGPVSGARQVAWATFPLPAVRAIGAALGGTVNDVMLSVLAGGLGRYLRAHGYRTAGLVLRVGCPVDMRAPAEQAVLGNALTIPSVPLYVDIADPVARLRAERTAMDRIKGAGEAATRYTWEQRLQRLPPLWLLLGAQVELPNTLFNAFATNIRGPERLLYLAGHQLERLYFLGPVGANLGVFHASLSYHEQLTLTMTADPQRLPDGWFYAANLEAAFTELQAAAAAIERTRSGGAADEPRRPAARRSRASR